MSNVIDETTSEEDVDTTSEDTATATEIQVEAAEPKVVEGPADSAMKFYKFGDTTLVMELPESETVKFTDGFYLLPGAPDTSHKLSPKQMATVVQFTKDNYPGGMDLLAVTRDLRTKYLKGRQKDWNIIGGFTRESRALTADEDMSDAQLEMITENIIPALAGLKPHFNDKVNGNIQKLSGSSRQILQDQFLQAIKKGDVTRTMAKFESVCGRVLPQNSDSTSSQAGLVDANQEVTYGDEEPF